MPWRVYKGILRSTNFFFHFESIQCDRNFDILGTNNHLFWVKKARVPNAVFFWQNSLLSNIVLLCKLYLHSINLNFSSRMIGESWYILLKTSTVRTCKFLLQVKASSWNLICKGTNQFSPTTFQEKIKIIENKYIQICGKIQISLICSHIVTTRTYTHAKRC